MSDNTTVLKGMAHYCMYFNREQKMSKTEKFTFLFILLTADGTGATAVAAVSILDKDH